MRLTLKSEARSQKVRKLTKSEALARLVQGFFQKQQVDFPKIKKPSKVTLLEKKNKRAVQACVVRAACVLSRVVPMIVAFLDVDSTPPPWVYPRTIPGVLRVGRTRRRHTPERGEEWCPGKKVQRSPDMCHSSHALSTTVSPHMVLISHGPLNSVLGVPDDRNPLGRP